jgi:hypothetical protein
MNSKFTFINHDELKGTHTLFSPSQSAWLRYEDDKIAERVLSQYRAPLGTEIHDFAAMEVTLNHKAKNIKSIVNGIESFIYTKYKTLSSDGEISDYYMKLIHNVSSLPKEVFEAIKYYINDGIGFKMTAEQPLKYSDNIYGTADSIAFKLDSKFLRIHDLKTGVTPASLHQLEIYASLFCLEYRIKPGELKGIELRIYQNNDILIGNPQADDILPIMDKIVHDDKIIENLKEESNKWVM